MRPSATASRPSRAGIGTDMDDSGRSRSVVLAWGAVAVILVTAIPILAAYYLTREGEHVAGAGK